ncbi:putative sporulation protein YtxC [Paenibacillus rigui]|uniref:Sporulation protein n=1 Tax=Paenibacillus rigui TaxID=554312 RepID=A0A229UTH9_9BACL|nr:putative sporulation protein YtxC [Paenibacillus rigui]OXM86633.1 sporulation protein [Paenibacillus rigui]
MKLFALTMMKSPDEAVHRLHKAVGEAIERMGHDDMTVELFGSETCSVIQVNGVLPRFQLDKRADALYKKAADVLAHWIVLEEEERLIRSLVAKDFDYKEEDDIRSILNYCRHMIQMESAEDPLEQTTLRRKHKIAEAAYAYLQEQTELNIDGFMRFRLSAYREELHDLAEYAIDEFLMDQQYQEFISLLKYFVYIQEAKIPLAHLIHKGGNEFLLLNDRMEPIDTSGNENTLTVEMLERDINFEDVIVSTLISVSPQQIYIHTRDPEVQVIQTITQIFENRVQLCEYCRLCQTLDRSAASDYNKG